MALSPTSLILDTGKILLAQLLTESKVSQVGQARIGASSGFVPTSDATSPSPSTVATISAYDIDVTIVNQNEARFTINFIETAGDYPIGNIILDLQYGDAFVPFAWYVLDDTIEKYAATSNDVGNSFAISFTVEWLNINDSISIIVETPTYASLPAYRNETVIPIPTQSLYQQFTIQQLTAFRTPALIMRRSADSKYFGVPFMQRLDDPFFGRLRGGNSGDRYLPYSGFTYWGGVLLTPSTDYLSQIGGGLLTDVAFDSVIKCDLLTYAEPT